MQDFTSLEKYLEPVVQVILSFTKCGMVDESTGSYELIIKLVNLYIAGTFLIYRGLVAHVLVPNRR